MRLLERPATGPGRLKRHRDPGQPGQSPRSARRRQRSIRSAEGAPWRRNRPTLALEYGVHMTVPLGLPGLSIQPGDHICAFHRGASARQDILTGYLRVGLSSGDKCICVLDRTDPEVLAAALGDAPAGTSQPHDGALEIYRSQEAYLAGGAFSVEAMLAFWEEKVGPAIAGGYRLARAAGEM